MVESGIRLNKLAAVCYNGSGRLQGEEKPSNSYVLIRVVLAHLVITFCSLPGLIGPLAPNFGSEA